MTSSALECSSFAAMCVSIALIMILVGVGRLCTSGWRRGGWTPESLALMLPIGLMVVIAGASVAGLGRLNFLVLPALTVMAVRFAPQRWVCRDDAASELGLREAGMLLLAFLACAVLMNHVMLSGQQALGFITPNRDLSYFAILAQEIPKAGVASQWAAVMGEHTRGAGIESDIWYHWGPIWLTWLVHKAAGISALDALIKVVAPVLQFTMLVCFAAIVRVMSGWALARSLVVSVFALVAMSWPSITFLTHLYRWLQTDLDPYVHWNLTYQFSYKFEATLVFGAFAAWTKRWDAWALALLLGAGISAPHNVAGLGLALGALSALGLVLRDSRMLRTGATGVAVLLVGWALVKVLFGVGLPKADNASLIVLEWAEICRRLPLLGMDLLVGLMESAIVIPGLIWLGRTRELSGDRGQSLGWLALAALVACYPAYRFLLPSGEHGHFTNYTHAVLVFPIGLLGLVLAAHSAMRVWFRHLGALLMFAAIAFGIMDMVNDHRMAANGVASFAAKDLEAVGKIVQGRRIGFFSTNDRNWWIPANSSITAFIGSPCVRLNFFPKLDAESAVAAFYGAKAPFQLVPRVEGESSVQWSMRYAKALDVQFLLVTPVDYLPAELESRVTIAYEAAALKLYALH